jgi:hypothetical protein
METIMIAALVDCAFLFWMLNLQTESHIMRFLISPRDCAKAHGNGKGKKLKPRSVSHCPFLHGGGNSRQRPILRAYPKIKRNA